MVTRVLKIFLVTGLTVIQPVLGGVLIFGSLNPECAYAAPVVVSADVSPRKGVLGDAFIFTVTIEGDSAGRPELEESQDFDVSYIGPSSEVSIINGSVKSSVSHAFRLIPSRKGDLHTPKGSVEVGGERYEIEPLEVRIAAMPDERTDDQPTNDSSKDYFLSQTLSRDHIFLNQQVINAIHLYLAVNIAQPKLSDTPLDGFWQEAVGNEENDRKVVNGKPYQVITLKRALFPLRTGALKVPARELTAKVATRSPLSSAFDLIDPSFIDQFMLRGRIKDIKLRSPEVSVDVKPLPPKPGKFPDAGLSPVLVGQTEIKVSYSPDPIKVGESKTVTVEVTSTGNLAPLKSSLIPQSSSYRVYEEAPVTQHVENNQQLISKRSTKVSLVPLNGGKVEIPPLLLGYFDPTSESYKIAKTDSISFDVEGAIPAPTANKIESLQVTPLPEPSQVLVPLTYEPPSELDRALRYLSPQSIILGVIGVALLLGGLIFRASRGRGERVAQQQIEKSIHSAVTPEALRGALNEVIKLRWAVNSASLSSEEIREALLVRGVKGALLFGLGSLLEEFDLLRFGGRKLNSEDISALRERLLSVLKAPLD